MGHEGGYTKAEILDLSENCQDFDLDSSTWLRSTLDQQKGRTGNHNILGRSVSAEELKIRSEMGMEIERDLEEEIKEGIYHLALRLSRLYQQRKEKNAKEEASSERGNTVLSELNIRIRMEGGTKIEIREVSKEKGEKGYCPSPRNNYRAQNEKKVDWVKTLRECSSPVCVSRTCASSRQRDRIRRLSNVSDVFSCSKIHGQKGNNVAGYGRLVKQNNASADKKLLQVGWKV
ncbi:hypothetical protein RJT34_06716 [Clitoria ternatea]|uniref:Uncharacterized protein n=1 Tax=Clitoria ternatea TaxID=43366 RepID=A0AAN9K3Q0_CLITE